MQVLVGLPCIRQKVKGCPVMPHRVLGVRHKFPNIRFYPTHPLAPLSQSVFGLRQGSGGNIEHRQVFIALIQQVIY